jgi:CubicO group peptidase (beta-lactamase class C family)
LVEVLKDRPLVYKPGARSIYNQTEFAVVRLILEKVSGRPFERLLNDEIVRPLGLTSTRFSNLREEPDIAGSSTRSADIVPRRAPLYNWDGSKQQISEFIYPSWSYAAGGLYSSAADLAKLLQAIETGRLLSKASLQALQTPYRLNDGKDGTFGVAWVVRHRRGRLTVGHSGGPADSDIWMWPERGLSVAVLTDQQNFAPVLADGVAQIVDPAPAPSHAAVADDDPATSARLLAWAEGVAKGVADQDMLAKGAVRGMAQQLRMLQPVLAIAPGIQDWTLTATNSGPGGSRTRTYAARQGAAHMLWTFYLDREGKILGLAPQPE